MHVVLEAPANALDLCKDGSKVVVAGRSVFKIFSIEEEFVERDNLRVGKNINLNFSCNDVVWSPVDDQVSDDDKILFSFFLREKSVNS